jgi:hypothetical protein
VQFLRAGVFKEFKEIEDNPRRHTSIIFWLTTKPNPHAVINLFVSEKFKTKTEIDLQQAWEAFRHFGVD